MVALGRSADGVSPGMTPKVKERIKLAMYMWVTSTAKFCPMQTRLPVLSFEQVFQKTFQLLFSIFTFFLPNPNTQTLSVS
jgi:hypothetical protein